jgi:hypothetical protein
MRDNEKSPQADRQEGQEKRNSNNLLSLLSQKGLVVNNIPDELKELEDWICWKLERHNGKLTKAPISPFSFGRASVNYPNSWNTFDSASNYAARNGINGIGIVLTDKDPYCGIDIDNCRNPQTGEMTDLAKKIIQMFDSYTEISPSKKGIHIFLKGKLPGTGRKNPALGLEVYDSKRYFTVTGNILDNKKQIHCRQSELEAFLSEHFKSEPPETNEASESYAGIWSHFNDEEIIEKAMQAANGNKFKQLWEGDWEGAGYPSHSEADLALSSMLKFYIGDDPHRIKRIFEQSGLYRVKWDRSDYTERTIGKALENKQRSKSMSQNDDNWEPNLKEWPQLDSKALAGIAGEFVALATKNSEADPVAVLATFLAHFGIECGPNPHIMVGDDKHYARLFASVVGDTSKARKGTSAQPVVRLFSKLSSLSSLNSSNENIIYAPARTSPGPLSSGEGLIYAVRDPVKSWDVKIGAYKIADPGIDDKRLFVLDQELASALQCTKREGNTLSTILRGLWDSGNVDPLTKTSKICTTGSHLGIVTHITIAELTRLLPETELLSGFSNRFVWIVARRAKMVPMPTPMPDAKLERIAEKICTLVAQAQKLGRVELSLQAQEFWKGVYPELSKAHPGLMGAVINRAEAQVIRLALIYALLDGNAVIEQKHLESALALWNYAEASARLIFGDREENPIAQKILELLKDGPKSATEIHRSFSNNIDKKKLDRAVNELKATSRLSVTKKPVPKGKPKTIFSLNEENEINEVNDNTNS